MRFSVEQGPERILKPAVVLTPDTYVTVPYSIRTVGRFRERSSAWRIALHMLAVVVAPRKRICISTLHIARPKKLTMSMGYSSLYRKVTDQPRSYTSPPRGTKFLKLLLPRFRPPQSNPSPLFTMASLLLFLSTLALFSLSVAQSQSDDALRCKDHPAFTLSLNPC